MPKLILLVAIAVTLFILIKRVQAMPPHKRRGGYGQLILGGAALAALLLTLSGKMHWVGAALTGLLVVLRQSLPLLIRAFPFLHQWWQRQQSSTTGQQSEVNSTILRMKLDHSSGELSGEVISGPFKDWLLYEMTHDQLLSLLDYCRSEDEDSTQLLTSYLEQRFPDGVTNDSDNGGQGGASVDSSMNRHEALAVLGLGDDASEQDILQAHRSLIQKLHPDRGGNHYLAAKINEAKDFLIH